MYKLKKQSGLALVSAIMLSSIVMIVIGVLLFRVVNTTKDVVLTQKVNAAKNIADEGLEHMVDWMNNRNSPVNYPTYSDPNYFLETQVTADKFLKPINDTLSIIDLSQNLLTGETTYKRFQNSDTLFSPLLGGKLLNVSPNGSTILELNPASNLYTFDAIDNTNNKNKIKGQFKVGAEKIATASKFDTIKVVSFSYVPSFSDPNKIVRKFVAIIQRPKDVTVKLENAILSDNTINMGNAGAEGATSTDDAAIKLVTKDGDVHSNHDVTLGPGAYIDGDATAYGSVLNSTNGAEVVTGDPRVTGVVTQNAPYKPVPEANYQNPFPVLPCVDSTPPLDGKLVYNGPCTVYGNLSLNGGTETLTITGKVYVTGDYKETGGNSVVIQSGSPDAMLVVQGNVTTAGASQSSYDSGNRLSVVSVTGNIEIKGTANVYGVFIGEDPNKDVVVTGNSEVFGGIVAKGEVTLKGNNVTVIRDTSLVNSPFKTPVESYNMRLVSWKEIK